MTPAFSFRTLAGFSSILSSTRGFLRKKALQDTCRSQPVNEHDDVTSLMQKTLQDMCLSQPALFVGFISSLSSVTLQGEIAVYIRKIYSRGLLFLPWNP